MGLSSVVAASCSLRRTAALASVGLELWGQTREESSIYAVSAITGQVLFHDVVPADLRAKVLAGDEAE